MSPLEMGFAAIGVAFALALIGLPIGPAMILTACGGMLLTVGGNFIPHSPSKSLISLS